MNVEADIPRSEQVLIRTKLNRPKLPAQQVVRPRLIERFDEAADNRVTLVSAPAGYGKTTLAVQWLEQAVGKVAWIALDPADSDPERFLRYLVTAFQELLPGSLRRAAALLEAVSSPPWSHVTEVLISELSDFNEPAVLAFDDYQTVDSQVIHELVVQMVEALPETMHLLVLSRTDPPLPLARWRGRRWLVDVRQQDLRFSNDEVSAFFETGPRLGLSEADLASIAKRTEGWAVGLQLARISLARARNRPESARRLSGSDRLIADYLMEEVLASQPAEVRRLLAVTAPLDRFCEPLCRKLLGNEGSLDAAEILGRMERENLFLVPLDSEHHWFRYHHLFRELLEDHLPEAASPDHRRDVKLRAAEWFAEEDLVEEALLHWVDAGDLDRAAELLGGHLDRVLDDDHSLSILNRWLEIFPPGADRGRMPLLVGHACRLFMRWDLPGVALRVEHAKELQVGDFAPVLAALQAFLCFWQRDCEGALRYADRALDQIEGRHRSWARSLAVIYRGGALYQSGRASEALQFLEMEAEREGLRRGRHVGRILTACAHLDHYAGNLEGVRTVAQRVVAMHDFNPTAEHWLGEAHWLLGAVALQRDLIEEATEHFHQVISRRYMVLGRFYLDAVIALALLAERQADAEAFDDWSATARGWAFESGDPESIQIVESFESRSVGRSGTPAPPGPPPSPEADALSVWFEVPSATYAERLLRHPDPRVRAKARPYLERAIASARACNNRRLAIEYSVLLAEALADAGEWEEAMEELGPTLDLAAPQGMLRPLFGGGPRRRELLEALAKAGNHQDFIDRVLRSEDSRGMPGTAGNDAAAPNAKRASATGPLTLRELETLELVAERLTNKEIAAKLNVTSEAIKKRLASIYDKLDVHDRRQAVEAAATLGIL